MKIKAMLFGLVVDSIFIAAVLFISTFFNIFLIPIARKNVFLNGLFLLTYLSLFLVMYSMAKYKVLNKISKKGCSVVKFITFNLSFFSIIALIFMSGYWAINFFIAEEYQGIYFLLFFAIYFILSYLLLNVMQGFIISGRKIQNISLAILSNARKYLLILSIELSSLVVLYLLYRAVFFESIVINALFQMITLIMVIGFNAYNRIILFEGLNKI